MRGLKKANERSKDFRGRLGVEREAVGKLKKILIIFLSRFDADFSNESFSKDFVWKL